MGIQRLARYLWNSFRAYCSQHGINIAQKHGRLWWMFLLSGVGGHHSEQFWPKLIGTALNPEKEFLQIKREVCGRFPENQNSAWNWKNSMNLLLLLSRLALAMSTAVDMFEKLETFGKVKIDRVWKMEGIWNKVILMPVENDWCKGIW